MTDTAPSLVDLFELDQDALRCPHEVWRPVRDAGPVHWVEETGHFVVTRYDDILAVVRDPETFSSRLPTGPHAGQRLIQRMTELAEAKPEVAELLARSGRESRSATLLSADPPDHQRQRLLVNQAFTPRRVRQLEDEIRLLTEQLIDDFVDEGAVELVGRFAVLLPLTVIARALGVPEHELAQFKRWSDDLVVPVGDHDPPPERVEAFIRSNAEFNDYFSAKLAERRADPRDDLITDVVQARLDGDELRQDEMLAMLQQFLVAGNETTTKLITYLVLRLAEDPELQTRVRGDGDLIPGLVEEVLRLETPVQGLYRTANVDTEIAGVAIPEGAHVMCVYASGNRDEERFPDPDRCDPARSNSRQHLAFGQGPHYCIGANLARSEARLATEIILRRLHDIELVADAPPMVAEPSYVLHGLKQLHVRFTAVP
ncbi:MAG: cytochrome P450 [Actinomycetota bacterium]